MDISGNTMLITGGASGIGRGLAEAFHRRGNQVIIAGRRQAALDAVVAANPGMRGYAVDITDPASIAALAQAVTADHPQLNMLVNNAGIMRHHELTPDHIDTEAAEAIIATNLLGPIRMTATLLPHLRAHENAVIANVTSGLAYVPLAHTATYCAAKAGLHSWTVSLRYMLAKDGGPEVIEIAPPAVQTDLTPGQSTHPAYMPLEDYLAEVMALFERQPTPAEICVERALFLRNAEKEDRFDWTVNEVNGRMS